MTSLTQSAPCSVCAAAREQLVALEVDAHDLGEIVKQGNASTRQRRSLEWTLRQVQETERFLEKLDAQCPHHHSHSKGER